MREFHCKDVGMPDCSFVAKGKDDDEVMRKAAEHAKRDAPPAAVGGLTLRRQVSSGDSALAFYRAGNVSAG